LLLAEPVDPRDSAPHDLGADDVAVERVRALPVADRDHHVVEAYVHGQRPRARRVSEPLRPSSIRRVIADRSEPFEGRRPKWQTRGILTCPAAFAPGRPG